MKNILKTVSTALIASLFTATIASASVGNWNVVQLGDNGKTIDAKVGEQIDVLLDENTHTADNWAFQKVNGDAVSLKNEDHVDGDMVRNDGSFAATYEGVFRAEKAGTSTIEIVAKDSRGNPTTFKVTVVVE